MAPQRYVYPIGTRALSLKVNKAHFVNEAAAFKQERLGPLLSRRQVHFLQKSFLGVRGQVLGLKGQRKARALHFSPPSHLISGNRRENPQRVARKTNFMNSYEYLNMQNLILFVGVLVSAYLI